MSAVATVPSILADYEAFERSLPAQPAEVAALRARGRDRFAVVGFPKTRDEDWRHTNVAPIARTTFRQPSGESRLDRQKLEPFLVPECDDLVFVNGRFVPELSATPKLPEGAYAGSLAAALAEKPELVLPHLGQHADIDKNPFVALNTAHVHDGAFVYAPRGTVIERPIQLLFISISEDETPIVSYPRNLFVAGETAQFTVLETYGGFGEEKYFSCPVTEIAGEQSSVIDHYRLGQESMGAFHMATQKTWLSRDANFFSHSVSLGGLLVRNDIQADLDGEGIECTLNGLYLTRGKQHVDHHMWVEHAKPNCNSYELFKGILEEQSRAVFNGRIFVAEGAQKTDAKQSNRNLLLSKEALVHSNPQLEIFADDVRCTHGSTTGHLDDEAVFYLRSRGIGEEAAKSLLTYAFAGEVLQEIRLETVRKDLEEYLFTRLPKGDIVRQAV